MNAGAALDTFEADMYGEERDKVESQSDSEAEGECVSQ
jgi:hypothetical protein